MSWGPWQQFSRRQYGQDIYEGNAYRFNKKKSLFAEREMFMYCGGGCRYKGIIKLLDVDHHQLYMREFDELDFNENHPFWGTSGLRNFLRFVELMSDEMCENHEKLKLEEML